MTTKKTLPTFEAQVREAFANNTFYYYREEYPMFDDFPDFGALPDSESITYELSENGLVDSELPQAVVFSFAELQNNLRDFLKEHPHYQESAFAEQLEGFLYDDFTS